MAFSYSGAEDILRGIPKVWTGGTIYSFKTTEELRLSVDHNPFIRVSSGTEFIIKEGVDYIFDRDNTIMYSYPPPSEQAPATYYSQVTTDNDIYASSGFSTITTIATVDELTSYALYARVAYWKVTAATITMKVTVGATTLQSIDVYCPTSQYTILAFNVPLTTTIPANSIVKLEIENGGTNDTVVGSRVPTELSIRDTA